MRCTTRRQVIWIGAARATLDADRAGYLAASRGRVSRIVSHATLPCCSSCSDVRVSDPPEIPVSRGGETGTPGCVLDNGALLAVAVVMS